MPDQLIHIGQRKGSANFAQKIEGAPVVDKFFLVALISAFIGLGVLGAGLWLIRSGQVQYVINYQRIRDMHALLQIYLFYACFMLGFLFQAAPKLFLSPVPVSRWSPLLLVPLTLGVFLRASLLLSFLGSVLIAVSFFMALCFLGMVFRQADRTALICVAGPACIGLLSLLLGAGINIADPNQAVVLFWGGIGGCIFAASQQFISGFLGGQRLALPEGVLFCLVFIISLVLLLSFSAWRIGAVVMLFTFLLFLHATRSWKLFFSRKNTSIAWAFRFAWIWGLSGCLQLFQGMEASDTALHMWASGWGMSLILGVAPRIISFLSGRSIMRESWLISLLFLWQIVPLGRGFWQLLPAEFAWFVSGAIILTLLVWGLAMLGGIVRILRKQFQLVQGERMVQC